MVMENKNYHTHAENKIENARTHKFAHNWKIKERRRKIGSIISSFFLHSSFNGWSFVFTIKTYLDCLGLYGGGVDERVERRGWMGGSSVCPCGLSHVDKLRVLLMPPRNNVLLLDGATSSSMLRGNSEIECFREELDGTSNDDDHILLPRMMVMTFFVMPCCTNSQTTLPGVSCR
jgi:hypothetical protein